MATHPELPNDIGAERAVLGSIFLNRDAIIPVAPRLQPEQFYLERHNWIFAAMLECYSKRVPPDSKAVSIALKRAGRLDAVGGHGYLAELIDEVPTSSNVEAYAQAVLDCASRRALISVGGKIAAQGWQQPDAEVAQGNAWALLNEAIIHTGNQDYVPFGEGGYEQLKRMEEGVAPGTSTGFRDLDAITGGLHKGDLIVLAARPSVGKSSLALNIACNVAEHTGPVLYSSLEMSNDELRLRAVSMRSGLDLQALRLNALGDDDDLLRRIAEAFGWVHDLSLWLDSGVGQTVQGVRKRALKFQAEHGEVALLVVDYLQLMTDVAKKNSNRVEDVSAISRGLKALARELNIPVLALSQLSRAVEGRASHVPMLSDLRESGAIEQDSDVVMFIYRHELYEKDTDRKGIAEIHIAKHRNGPLGVVPMRFDGSTTSFSDLSYRTVEGY